MSKEIPLQQDMFNGEWVDTRTKRQKHNDRQQELPHQEAMFSQRDIAQFGVTAHPLMPLSDDSKLVLEQEDPRTDEEKAHDLAREVEEKSTSLFELPAGTHSSPDETSTTR
jgi:hypothetical protein